MHGPRRLPRDNGFQSYGVFRWLTHQLPGVFIFLVSPGHFKPDAFARRLA